jgi:DNA-binding SARP family transcriptional activator/tetratricopeptide (TPR) repeat protein
MRFRILGPLEVWSEGGWTGISAAKWRSLLACLLLRPGQLVSTDALIVELWGDNPPARANNLVSIYVHRLRRLIGDSEGRVLVYRAPGYQLRVGPDDLDLHEFESLVADGRRALAAGEAEPAASALAAAQALWRGPLLADVSPSASITTEAERADELRLAAAELRIEAELACYRSAQVIPELRRLVAENPIREGLWLLLMRALDEAGRHAEALDTYTQARAAIAEELGVDPGAELQRLHADLLAADASTAQPKPSWRPDLPARTHPAVDEPADATAVAAEQAYSDDGALAEEAGGETESGEVLGTIAIGSISETVATPDAPVPAGRAVADALGQLARPAQLPADIGDFTGRDSEVSQLCEMLVKENAETSPGAVRIAVVAGAAGLGKTTLAVHAAHQVREWFPDGQLYVDLFGASSQPAATGEVLARFLRDLGVDGDKVPVGEDERAALYRTSLTGRRVLVVLDNAGDAAQVRPLLPGSASCAVLVTTRNSAPDLARTRFVDLNVLDDAEALTLFSRIVGDERPAAEPDATAEVLLACAGLPLAIRICAARLAARRKWKIATMAHRLRDERRRLDELEAGDLAVRASFQVSYDSLGPRKHGADPARAFRVLGLWQGQSISLPAAAALLGEPDDDVADALETLVDVNLLESPAPDWYRFHDLLRFFATERAQEQEPAQARDEAAGRLLRWYLYTVQGAAEVVSPHRYRLPMNSPPDVAALPLASVAEALSWYDTERSNVMAAIRQAASLGMHDVAWRLPTALLPLFNRWDNWADCIAAHRIAVDSTRKAGDQRGEAWVLTQLGISLARLRDEEAFAHLERALEIRQALGDQTGEVQSAIGLADAYYRIRGPEAALEPTKGCLELLHKLDNPSLLGTCLVNLGEIYLDLGRLDEAADCFEQARDVWRGIGGYGHGHALHNLGRIYLDLHRPDDAIAELTEAIRLHREAGDLIGQGTALKYLGEAHRHRGDYEDARQSWAMARAIFDQLGESAESDEVVAALAALPPASSRG